jgi:hypothetical protein
MTFKGIISIGSTVEAGFSSDTSNSGSASLFIGLSSESENAKNAVIAIGGAASLRRQVNSPGLLRVFVDAAGKRDSGMLELEEIGGQHDGPCQNHLLAGLSGRR